ncbi:MAG: xanthine dehydrogenase family protein [Thaumarchaeota archaeon]|nr:xanthine dehydrogenase family protein [Nitrososphaerota archaeon]
MPKYIGVSVKRVEDRRFIRGGGQYVDDVELPGMLYGRALRSPYASAKIKSIDTSEAEKSPGVVAVLTGQQAKKFSKPWRHYLSPIPEYVYAFGVDRVKYVGQEVAAVAATDPGIAEDALDLINVEYEPLPVVVDPEEAMKDDAPLIHSDIPGIKNNIAYHYKLKAGDIERAFREADLVVKDRLSTGTSHSTPIEPIACVSSCDHVNNNVTVWVGTQAPLRMRSVLSETLGMRENRIRVIAPDIGGGFGVKVEAYPSYVVATMLSYKTGRPVKITLDRREDFLCTGHRHMNIRYPEVAVKKDGKILGWKEKVVVDVGHIVASGVSTVSKSCLIIPGAYKIDNVLIDAYCVWTNKGQCSANRGFGHPQSIFARERMMDLVAKELKIDPLELRLKNIVKPEDIPYESSSGPVFDTPNFEACLREAAKAIGWEEFRRKRQPNVGMGIAFMQKNNGGYQIGKTTDADSVSVRVEPSGTVTVFSSSVPQGQSHQTTMAQVAAEELGLDMDDIAVITGDTDKCPFGLGTWGSRTPLVTMGALYMAARRIRDKMIKIAAHNLDARPEDMVCGDGVFYVKNDHNRSLKFKEVANMAYKEPRKLPEGMEPTLSAEAAYDPPGKTPFDENGRSQVAATYDIAAHAAMVRVDPETGQVEILKYVVAHDGGIEINPMLVDGQIHGAVAHGIGIAFYEDLQWDQDGQLINPTFMDFHIPTSVEVPPDVGSIPIESFCPASPGGHRGMGESGTIAAPATLAAAVSDALGIRVKELPMTPERLANLVSVNRKQ